MGEAAVSEDGRSDEDASRWEKYQVDNANADRIATQVLQSLSSAISTTIENPEGKAGSIECALHVIKEIFGPSPSDFSLTTAQVDLLVDFSLSLQRRSENTGESGHENGDFLNDAITAAGAAVQVLSAEPAKQPQLLDRLDSLSAMLAIQSSWSGDAVLDRAIELEDKAVELTPSGDEAKISRLRRLSKLYESRYNRNGGSPKADMDRAIESFQRVLQDYPTLDEETKDGLKDEITCLRVRAGDDDTLPSVFEVPFDDIGNAPLVMDAVTPHRFRFLDCKAYVQKTALRVLDFKTIPKGRYATVSYIWKGLSSEGASDHAHPGIVVEGGEDADPISAVVLRTTCLAALSLNCDLLWLDRFSIIQTNDSDKGWQIKKMFEIYQSSAACLVLPGGVGRLAGLSEETPWIQRAWTLQEAVAPPKVMCIVSWPWGAAVHLQSHFPVMVVDIETGISGMVDLKSLLRGSLSAMRMRPTARDGARPDFGGSDILPINIFATSRAPVHALLGALNDRHRALRANAIWRSAFLRTCSRPVDMIFSIMGLVGVTLEPAAFGPGDRHRATVALARALLAKGEPARWLAISLDMEPDRRLSTLPVMPETSRGGRTYVKTSRGLEKAEDIAGSLWWWLKGAPRGSMNEDGYFRFVARAAPVARITQEASQSEPTEGVAPGKAVIKSQSGQKWCILNANEARGQTVPYFAVVIGKSKQYTDATYGVFVSYENTVVMFLRQHATGKWHNTEYGRVNDVLAAAWEHQQFDVGGPEPIEEDATASEL
ncbi:hypothetical protein F4779DRAFT_621642 [Xylariaceae sp. FL0662B]|nr:hypothetical protein F4779DRAFT_621642 [Xylariaceae sp. FL0662B]